MKKKILGIAVACVAASATTLFAEHVMFSLGTSTVSEAKTFGECKNERIAFSESWTEEQHSMWVQYYDRSGDLVGFALNDSGTVYRSFYCAWNFGDEE
jgi:hypothetical protein